jgi:nitroreductase
VTLFKNLITFNDPFLVYMHYSLSETDMDFLELAKSRYSCRNYRQEPVDDKIIDQLFEAVRVAPSAVNYQPWHFIVIKSPENKAKIVEAYFREWFKTAPMYIIACGDRSKSWKRGDGKDFLDVDLSIAIDHLTLQATALGLATCWVCNFNVQVLKTNLRLPSQLEPIAIIPVGYPNDLPDKNRHELKRKKTGEILSWEIID